MNRAIFSVTKFEVVRQIKKPAFWAAILLMSILMGVAALIGYFAEQAEVDTGVDESKQIVIVDEAGVLPQGLPIVIDAEHDKGIEMVKEGKADLYFYIPEDFAESKKVEFYHISEGLDLFNFDGNAIKTILAQVAAEKVDAMDVLALTGGFEVEDNKLTVTGEAENAIGKAIIPIMILVVFFMFVALFGNRFLMAVVEEKENRISEMILTAVSAKHLIIGKIIALMILGMIQVATFVVPVVVLVALNRENPMVATVLNMIEADPVTITMNLVLFFASMFFYAGTCTFVGSLVSTARDASSFIGPAIIAMVLPMYFMQIFLSGDVNFFVQFLTYFPLSAPTSLMLRSGFGTLSMVEFVIGLAEVIILAVVMIRLAVGSFQKNAINFDVAFKLFSGRERHNRRG